MISDNVHVTRGTEYIYVDEIQRLPRKEVPMTTNSVVKKAYASPKLTAHGSVEEMTLGSGNGIFDVFVFGSTDINGNCGNGSCSGGGSSSTGS